MGFGKTLKKIAKGVVIVAPAVITIATETQKVSKAFKSGNSSKDKDSK